MAVIADKIENKQHLSNSAPDLEVKKKTRKRENKLASVKTSSQALAAHLTVQKYCRGKFGRNTGIEFPSHRSTEIWFFLQAVRARAAGEKPFEKSSPPIYDNKGSCHTQKKT